MTRRYRLHPDKLDWREIEGEIVALDHGRSVYLGVNRTGAFLWSMLATGATLDEMRDALIAEYDLDAERAGTDVTAFLEMLETHGVLDEPEEA